MARRQDPGTGAVSSSRRAVVLAVLCVSLLVVNLDSTILNVALPTIVRDLHATSSELQWIVDAYAMVFAGLLLTLGGLGDRIGRKRVFTGGLTLFALGSATAAFSSTPGRLIAARAFMGIGAAAIMPSTLSILTNVFVEEGARAKAIGIWSGTTGLGVALGPIAGGWLLAHYFWGSVFLVNVPIALAGIVASICFVPESKNPLPRRLDPMGSVLSTLGLGLLLWGIIEAPQRTWRSGPVILALCAGTVVLAVFVLVERRSRHPMLDLAFFSSRRFSAAMAAMALVLFSLSGLLFLLTQWLQFSLGYGPFATGLRIGPIALILMVMAPLSALVARRLGTKLPVALGMAGIAAGLVLLSRTSIAGTYAGALPAFVLLGIGAGLAFAPSTESVMGSLPRARAGIGSATNSAALQVGGALGVGVLGSLLNSRYQSRISPVLAEHRVPASVVHVVQGSLGAALVLGQHIGGSGGAALETLAKSAFVGGLDLAVLVGGVIAFVGVVVVVTLLPNRPNPAPEALDKAESLRCRTRLQGPRQSRLIAAAEAEKQRAKVPFSNPTHRADGHRRRVLLETPDGARAFMHRNALQREGYDVAWCPGPGGPSSCPLLWNRRCPLVESADAVVWALGLHLRSAQSVLRALGDLEQAPPVIVSCPEPQAARWAQLIRGHRVVSAPPTTPELLAALDEVLR